METYKSPWAVGSDLTHREKQNQLGFQGECLLIGKTSESPCKGKGSEKGRIVRPSSVTTSLYLRCLLQSLVLRRCPKRLEGTIGLGRSQKYLGSNVGSGTTQPLWTSVSSMLSTVRTSDALI